MSAPVARAQAATGFVRVVPPTTTVIKAFSPDGTLVWSSAAAVGVTGCNQRAALLTGSGSGNWANVAELTVTGRVMALRVFDPNPPAGTE